MKRYLSILILIFSIVLIISVSIFGILRNQTKKSFKKSIIYSGENVFLNDSLVNKLLTQILHDKFLKTKDSLDLNIIESELKNNHFIEKVEVYWKFYDFLEIKIKEREPLYILKNEKFYVDSYGKFFPMKKNERDLPKVFTKLSKDNLNIITKFILKVNQDNFMKRELNKIYFKNNEFKINLKSYDFNIIFGNSKRLNEKIEKLKVFCAFQNAQDSLKNYPVVNLNYLNQVIASKSLVYEK